MHFERHVPDLVEQDAPAVCRFDASDPAQVGAGTGPLIAGVVGSKSFSYDVWGDDVNVAARIESGGSVGAITISEYTRNLVENHFELAFAGDIEAKNKGVRRI